MRASTRYLTAAGSAAVLAITLLAASPAAAGSGHHGIDWQPCPDTDPAEAVECATIEVPLDYDRPRGETIEIGLARRQAANPDEKLGTILMDPGGPGGSGVDSVKQYNPLTGEAAERFDIVGFDPRGVNTSTQVLCGIDAVAAVDAVGVPTDQDSFEALEDANAALTEDCRERTGRLFDHVSNLETVEDMERIRRALGEGRLNYLGYSYGTIMGQQYAEAYPRKIRTMVLDGNMDHSLASVWEFMSTETEAVEENFAAFTAWCAGAPACALHGEDVTALYSEIKAKARAGELLDPDTGEPLDFYALSMQYTFAANSPHAWPSLAEAYVAMRDGTPLSGLTALQEEDEVEHLYYPAWCQDYGWEIEDYEELADLQERLTEDYPNVEWTPYNNHALTCVGSGIEHTNEREELDVDHAPPIVFIGNEHDPATVYDWTLASAEQADGHLVTYEGYGHTVYGGISECIDEAVNAYFVDRAVPEAGLSCPNLDFPGVGALNDRRVPRTAGPF
ncbi:alpha/beta hydrolase [Glycomyces algeriensis]|uniref:Peptidase n=1 Tax=Glycomyces algeriensis TaxID=256037 RepID=A0A9W6GAJ3_9ACTN|nr:alpha/beta hydrolase [Glycomyces algeriensis]MDA1364533.1 alpha/beta hydrolase [Glycomyces algeriensis]MDR7350569.1 pimeloyl-ACP methyl ester carboxylesterase [Glycomyces algeriensis]GLI43277.1 peptidase [Glycomyces algeriensis]